MNKPYPFAELQDKIVNSQRILIVLPERPVFDQVAAGLALFLSLQGAKKNVFITCPTPTTVEFNHLVGVDKISEKIYGSDLIVSFNYPTEQIEKVSYNDDNGRPNIVIQIKNGAPSINENLAKFSYAGLEADLIIAVGARNPGQLAFLNQDLTGKTLINIDIDPSNLQYGQINVVDCSSSGWGETVLGIILGLNLPLSPDISQNVLSGIFKQTQNLYSRNIGADTYEAVAICLRAGAQKPDVSELKEEFTDRMRIEKTPQIKNDQSKPPADWFEPKIFKGTNLS